MLTERLVDAGQVADRLRVELDELERERRRARFTVGRRRRRSEARYARALAEELAGRCSFTASDPASAA